jgi:predicted AAA+ superfamily ATPase
VRSLLSTSKCLIIDLLNVDLFENYLQNPQLLEAEIRAQADVLQWVFIDEVQKIPSLLDIVHGLMEDKKTKNIKFALSGSSARKLKVAGANLLAGRAFSNELYPFTSIELNELFDIDSALNWGTLPKIFELNDDDSKKEYLRTYGRVYLKEEVWDERLIHNLSPFRKFLEIAGQTSGMILNFSKIAKQTGVDDKTIKKYFEILVDTFLGFYLESYSESVRVQQISSPKFYLFDTGVKRSLEGLLNAPIVAGTYAYGRAFEHFIMCEAHRLNSYLRKDFKFSYLKTKSDLEIDLIINRPGQSKVLVEIKSTSQISDDDASTLNHFVDDFPGASFQIWSQDLRPKQFGHVKAVHWQDALRSLFY